MWTADEIRNDDDLRSQRYQLKQLVKEQPEKIHFETHDLSDTGAAL